VAKPCEHWSVLGAPWHKNCIEQHTRMQCSAIQRPPTHEQHLLYTTQHPTESPHCTAVHPEEATHRCLDIHIGAVVQKALAYLPVPCLCSYCEGSGPILQL